MMCKHCQNETLIQAYKANGKDYKNMIFGYDIFDDRCIDVSGNYGREIRHEEFLFIAAFCSWFKVEFVKKLLKLDSLIFDSMEEMKELENGLFRIKLFKKIDVEYSMLREKQKRFVEVLGLLQ